MGIETKYEYIYYTVIDTEQWRRGNEEWFGEDGFTWEKAIEFISHKLKTSEDESLHKYKVEYAQYNHNIENWRHTLIIHKERPVFVQFQDDQPIKTVGEGSMFVLYEDDGVHYSSASDDDGNQEVEQFLYGGNVDGLAGLGGRL